jgi:hypothetical protein
MTPVQLSIPRSLQYRLGTARSFSTLGNVALNRLPDPSVHFRHSVLPVCGEKEFGPVQWGHCRSRFYTSRGTAKVPNCLEVHGSELTKQHANRSCLVHLIDFLCFRLRPPNQNGYGP